MRGALQINYGINTMSIVKTKALLVGENIITVFNIQTSDGVLTGLQNFLKSLLKASSKGWWWKNI